MILQVCSNLTAADWTRACAWKVEIFRRRFSVFSRHAQARRTPRWEWGADAQRTERTIQNSTYSWYYYSIPYGSSHTFLGSGTGVWFGGCLVPSQEVFGSIGHSSIVVFTCFFLSGFHRILFLKAHPNVVFSNDIYMIFPSICISQHSQWDQVAVPYGCSLGYVHIRINIGDQNTYERIHCNREKKVLGLMFMFIIFFCTF